MFYINPQEKVFPPPEENLLNIVLIPPEERTTRDHQLVFHFFKDHEIFKDIERTKSLNARIKCIAHLILVEQADFNPTEHLAVHHCQDGRAIVLPLSVKKAAEEFNERQIRQKMDRIAQYTLVKSLKYNEFLYLAQHLQIHHCNLKDYLYRQNEPTQYVYLLEQGQFHYIKHCGDQTAKKTSPKKKKQTLKSMESRDESPNKHTRPQLKKFNIGIVQGKLGQTVGLEEVALKQQFRKYSVICNSAHNVLLKIHKTHFQTLLEELPLFHEEVTTQMKNSTSNKDQIYNKIKYTQSQIKQYLKKSDNPKVNSPQNNHHQNDPEHTKDNNQPSISRSRYKLPAVVNKRTSGEYKSRNHSLASASSHKKPKEHTIQSMKSYEHLDAQSNEDEKYVDFALTSLQEPQRTPLETRISEEKERQTSKSILQLPVIGKKEALDIDISSSLNLKKQSSTLLQQEPSKSRLKHYGGMIDAAKLVEGKQSVLDKKITGLTRTELFPSGHIEYKKPQRFQLIDPMKLKASPAHSNRFMQAMLLKALKKSGYDQLSNSKESLKPQGKSLLVRNIKHSDFYQSLAKSNKKDHPLKKSDPVLVSSPFDDCFFHKL